MNNSCNKANFHYISQVHRTFVRVTSLSNSSQLDNCFVSFRRRQTLHQPVQITEEFAKLKYKIQRQVYIVTCLQMWHDIDCVMNVLHKSFTSMYCLQILTWKDGINYTVQCITNGRYICIQLVYFYFLHMNEEHLNMQQWNSKTQNTYNKHVQTKTENQLCNR